MRPRVLVVDDDTAVLFGLTHYLDRIGFEPTQAQSLAEARQHIHEHQFDIIMLDMRLPDGDGLEWIPNLREMLPDVAIVVITGYGDIPLAVEAMRRGADHFLTKPVNLDDLEVFLRKSIELGTLRRRVSAYRRLDRGPVMYFGETPIMREVRRLAQLAAESDAPVLILGETGTGKGMLARWIHAHSQRAPMPFVEVNCSSLRGELLASELFGHVRGAFTTAIRDRKGLVEAADGGTLFLDEIGDMDLAVQAQILQVIEEKQFRRLGEVRVRRSDFRLICATNQDLDRAVQSRRFRRDLYYRIHVFPIYMPPLRDRREDIPGLVRHILQHLGAGDREVTRAALERLQTYDWPGNVRELRNALERALILAPSGPLLPEHFAFLQTAPEEATASATPVGDDEVARILATIRQCGGNKKRAAQVLGISRSTLYRKIRKAKARHRE